jgi:hypothetical protein
VELDGLSSGMQRFAPNACSDFRIPIVVLLGNNAEQLIRFLKGFKQAIVSALSLS